MGDQAVDVQDSVATRGFLQPTPKVRPAPCGDNASLGSGSAFVKTELGLEAVEISDDDQCNSESSSSSTSDESDDGCMEAVVNWQGWKDRNAARSSTELPNSFLVHSRRYTVHYRQSSSATRLKCGRLISKMFREVSDEPDFEYPRCKDCFGS